MHCLALPVTPTLRFVAGYYADQLSIAQETRGNLTVQFKNESRGFHLNNLSYAGPIIMGCGGKDGAVEERGTAEPNRAIIGDGALHSRPARRFADLNRPRGPSPRGPPRHALAPNRRDGHLGTRRRAAPGRADDKNNKERGVTVVQFMGHYGQRLPGRY